MQMPPGIPVATVAIDGAKNAGLLAIQMLALSDSKLMENWKTNKKTMADAVIAKSKKLEEQGYKNIWKTKMDN